nr:MAG TPA: hypothetical protein [Caudoviricetes sp.]
MNPPCGILRIRISAKASGTYISEALLISTHMVMCNCNQPA